LGKLATDEQFYQRLNSAVTGMDALVAGIRSGEGTVGRLFQDQTLYNNLNGTSVEVRELIADFRRDPKKFLTVQFRIF
jgi:phospholipid/cholesterol/gamma-HCH transport system substrate-binding protein